MPSDAVIRLQFALGTDWLSRLVAWFGGRVGKFGWSHVDAVLPGHGPGDPEAGWLLGARHDWCGKVPPGVQVRPPGYQKFKTTEAVEIPCTAAQRDDFYAGLRRRVDEPYSSTTIWGFLFGHDFDDRKAWVCDVLLAWQACKSNILPAFLFQYIRRLTPNTLYVIAKAVESERTRYR